MTLVLSSDAPRVHLVIPDPHATDDYPNTRFEYLGKFIMDLRPDVIECLGDFADCPSLSSYDKGKKSFEGKRFFRDVAATIDAQEKLFGPLQAYNERQRRFKEKQYKPVTVLHGGNHDEGRIARVTQDNPELSDFMGIDAFKYNTYWQHYVPYKIPAVIDGVSYCHHFPSGPMGRPIGGVTLGRSLLQKNFVSSTVGHDHRFDQHTQVRADGRRLWGLSAGCFFDFTPDYAKDTAHLWWRGVIVKRYVWNGDYELEQVSLNRLRAMYG